MSSWLPIEIARQRCRELRDEAAHARLAAQIGARNVSLRRRIAGAFLGLGYLLVDAGNALSNGGDQTMNGTNHTLTA